MIGERKYRARLVNGDSVWLRPDVDARDVLERGEAKELRRECGQGRLLDEGVVCQNGGGDFLIVAPWSILSVEVVKL